eukprot:gene35898-46607_t
MNEDLVDKLKALADRISQDDIRYPDIICVVESSNVYHGYYGHIGALKCTKYDLQISRAKAQSPEQEGADCSLAVSKAIRLLRPSSSGTASGLGRSSDTHAVAAKVRLRQLILSESHDHSEESGSTGRRSSIEDAGSGPVLAARFEKECDSLRRRNPALLNSFLMLFKPLSFHYQPHSGDRDRRPPFPPQPETRGIGHPQALPQLGINGKHIKYDQRAESFAVDPSLALSVTVRDTVLCLCELGWLFLKVADYLKQALAPAGSSGGQQLGLVVQAFGFALQKEVLHETAAQDLPIDYNSSSKQGGDLRQ